MPFHFLSRYDEPTVGACDPLNPISGFGRRYQKTRESRLVYMEAPIVSPMHSQSRLIPPMLKLNYVFYLNDPAFVINSAQVDTNFIYEIVDARLLFKRVKVLPTLQTNFEATLSRQNAKFPLYVTSVKQVAIPAANLTFSHTDVFAGN